MKGLLAIALTNALSATALALVVGAASRFVRRPGVVHAMWLLVFIDLLTPPVLVVPVLPSFGAAPEVVGASSGRSSVADGERSTGEIGPGSRADGSPAAGPAETLLALDADASTKGNGSAAKWFGPAWLLGTAIVLLLSLARGARFERLLARGTRAPRWMERRAGILARRLGLARWPGLRLVPERVSPMLWFRPGRMEIVFPGHLVRRLAPGELDALLGHELAHVRRGDHWVRWLELVATAAFFWHPVVWWARAGLRRSEESSCDAWVRRILPARGRDYAGGLVKTLEYLASSPRPADPALASGVGHFHHLEERLTMILKHDPPPLATRTQRVALAACGMAFLLVFPGAAERRAEQDAQAALESETAESGGVSDERAAIEAELRDLQRRQLELSSRLRELHRLDEERRLREEISRLESEGRADEARRLALEADRKARQADIEREHERLERARAEATAELETELVEAQHELQSAAAAGRPEDVERARHRVAALQEELEARAMAFERRSMDLESRARAVEFELQAEQARRMASEGDAEEAARMERELGRRAEEMSLVQEQRRAELERAELEQEAHRLERRAEELERGGDQRQAAELRRRAEEMRRATQRAQRDATGRAIRAELARVRVQLEYLLSLGDEDGGHAAEIDELRRAADELQRTLERMEAEVPEDAEVY